MKIPFINLKIQYDQIREDITKAINSVFESSTFILGDQVRMFEKEFSDYVGMPYAVGLNSGTDALHLALKAAGIGKDDEVLTVPNTATPTVSSIVQSGAKPIFADINERTMLINVSKIEKAITKKTRAIIPVHLYGQCADMDGIIAVAKKHRLVVIEDCAQAHGAEYKGKKAGTFGDFSCFSFYPTKNLGAYGDAGMVLCRNQQHYKKLMMLRQYGEDVRYNSVIDGFNSRMDEIQAAILRVKLKHLGLWNKRRKEVAKNYMEGITNPKITLPAISKDSEHVFHLFVVKADNREKFRKHIESAGIGTAIHYPVPLHLQPAYARLGYNKGDFPVAENVMGQIVSLPLFPELSGKEIDYIIDTINSY